MLIPLPRTVITSSQSLQRFIRFWDANSSGEVYRITIGLGGLGNGPELCIWSILALRCGTLASADSSGSVQFWDNSHGTLLKSHSCHKGDVNVLAAPGHTRVFSAGSDGQVYMVIKRKFIFWCTEKPVITLREFLCSLEPPVFVAEVNCRPSFESNNKLAMIFKLGITRGLTEPLMSHVHHEIRLKAHALHYFYSDSNYPSSQMLPNVAEIEEE